jgi:hypothetical protein
MKMRLKISRLQGIIAIGLGMTLFVGCGNTSSEDKTPKANTPKVYVNGDLHVVGKKGDMHFETYGGEKAFGAESFFFARDFYRGYASVVKLVDGVELHGVINLKGEKVIQIEHEGFVGMYQNGGYFPIGHGSKHGYIDSTGKIVIPETYDEGLGVYNGLFVLRKGLKVGVLDLEAKEVVPFIYDKVLGYAENGLMAVEKGRQWGYVDRTGKEVIPCMYASASSFEGDITIARKQKLYGLIGPNNEAITPMEFDEFKWETTAYEDKGSATGYSTAGKSLVTSGGYIIVRKGNRWGAIDPKGQVVVPFDFDYVGNSDNGAVSIGLEKRRGTYDIAKKEVKWYDENGKK